MKLHTKFKKQKLKLNEILENFRQSFFNQINKNKNKNNNLMRKLKKKRKGIE